MPVLIQGIKKQLLVLPDNTAVLPGHGEATSIGREKKDNPFLREDFE
jgi:glyoxylase-like metal-dependent hydrolase (beta-lactamase superfamily II)